MNEIFSQSIENLALKIKNSELTSVELCEKYIERIDKFEKEVKAWAFFDKKILLEKAADADEYRKSGKPVGSLHGVPVALQGLPPVNPLHVWIFYSQSSARITSHLQSLSPLSVVLAEIPRSSKFI